MKLKFKEITGQESLLMKKVKEFESSDRNVTSKEYSEFNATLIPHLVIEFRRSNFKPMLSFSTILHLFQEVRLKYNKLSQCYMSETDGTAFFNQNYWD